MKILKNRTLVMTMVLVLALALLAPIATLASVEGRRNTTLGLAGLSAILLLKGKTGAGLITAAGAAVAYSKYKDAKDDEYRYGGRDGRYYRSDSDRDCADREYSRRNGDRNDYRYRGRDGRYYRTDSERDRADREYSRRDRDRNDYRNTNWDRDNDKNHKDNGRHLGWYKNDRDKDHDRNKDRDRNRDRDRDHDKDRW